MKKQSLLLVLTILGIVGYGQIKFEPGYFINTNGEKTNCLIKNIDWHDNPSQIEYKLTEDEESKVGYIRNIKEFKVSDLKYIRATVDIDLSSEKLDRLSTNRNPEFQQKTLFLKLLVEGKAKLYLYEEGNLKRYFYQINDSKINQLVYKLYEISFNKMDKNTFYKQQLWTDIKCDNIKEKDVKSTKYSKHSLEKYFVKYNECVDPNYSNSQKREKRDLFNLSIKPGVNFSSLSTPEGEFFQGVSDNNTTFRIGLEGEFILPFNKNKWSIFVEPTYQYYKSEQEITSSNFQGTTTRKFTLDYKSIELPVGLRHFMFINDKFKIFVNAAYVVDFEFDSFYQVQIVNNPNPSQEIDIKSRTNIIGGLGVKWNDRLSLESRFSTNREISADSQYQTFSIIFGYTMF